MKRLIAIMVLCMFFLPSGTQVQDPPTKKEQRVENRKNSQDTTKFKEIKSQQTANSYELDSSLYDIKKFNSKLDSLKRENER